MNICVISFHSCPFSPLGLESSGGMNVYIKELSSALKNFPKIKMDIFTRVQNKKLRGIKNISSQVRVIHLKGGPEYFISRRNLYKHIKEFEENLEKFICNERINYEIIYTHYWLSGLIGERIKNKFNIPLIHNYHSLAFMKKKAIKKGYRENANRLKAEKFLSFISDGIITSSNNEKENMLKEYKIPCWKLKVIYPGVNPNIFYLIDKLKARKKLGFNHKDKIILYVGRIEPIKDLLTVVQAVELIKKNKIPFYENLKLIIIGGGKKSSDFHKNNEIIKIKNFIKIKNISDKVTFTGSKEQNVLKDYYSAADAVVVPSLYESFGLVTIESLACGTPVIASKIGETTKIIKENKNGFYFIPNNPNSLVNVLIHFFSNKNFLWKREEIRRNTIKKFSWERTAEETIDFLEKIIRIHHLKQKEFSMENIYHQISIR